MEGGGFFFGYRHVWIALFYLVRYDVAEPFHICWNKRALKVEQPKLVMNISTIQGM